MSVPDQTPDDDGPRLRHRRDWQTAVPRSAIRDGSLSFRAVGVLAYMLDKPDGWRFNAATMSDGQGREGREAVRAALRELYAAGYIRRNLRKGPRGRWLHDTDVDARPHPEWAAEHAQEVRKQSARKPAGQTGDGFPGDGGPGDGPPGDGGPGDIRDTEKGSDTSYRPALPTQQDVHHVLLGGMLPGMPADPQPPEPEPKAPNAGTVVAAFADEWKRTRAHLAVPPPMPSRIAGQVAREAKSLLDDGWSVAALLPLAEKLAREGVPYLMREAGRVGTAGAKPPNTTGAANPATEAAYAQGGPF